MKKINNAWQIYINKPLSEKDLIDFLKEELNLPVESLNYPDQQAQIFVMITTFESGFPVGVNISWNPKINLNSSYLELGKNLAHKFSTQVAIDSILDTDDPHRWTLVESDKKLFDIRDDSLQTSDRSLILDLATKKEINIYSK